MANLRTSEQTPGRRRQSEAKRAAILDAAEALFASDGYELTSVDAIAARAAVSKRTVYDHFGDKQSLFRSALGRSNDAMVATIRAAIDEELTEYRDLRDALVTFALRIATETFPRPGYATFRRLNSQAHLAPRMQETWQEQRQGMLEHRFTKFAADGELRIPDPHRAVQHFIALTMRLALDAYDRETAHPPDSLDIHPIVADGVDVFLRAYRHSG